MSTAGAFMALKLRSDFLNCAFDMGDHDSPPEPDHLYVIQSEDGPIKIGRSVNPKARVASLQTASPSRLRLVRLYPSEGHRERSLHRTFSPLHVRGEWFCAEVLPLLDELMA